MEKDFPVLVFISGRGSNFQALFRYQQDYRICGVISDNPDAKGLQVALEAEIEHTVLNRKDFLKKAEFEDALLREVAAFSPRLIALAGFMQILSPRFLEVCPTPVINIHPSLLPLLPGLRTHQRAISEGFTEHGCTVHLVDGGVDTGPILAQAKVSVLPEDLEEILSQRVLEREHKLYCWVIQQIARGHLHLTPRVRWENEAVSQAKDLGFILRGDCVNTVLNEREEES